MEGVQPGFVSLKLDDVYVTFRNQEVLRGVSWDVKTGDRVGLVGVNGGGKTTQLKILDGEVRSDKKEELRCNATTMLRRQNATLLIHFTNPLDATPSVLPSFLPARSSALALPRSLFPARANGRRRCQVNL
jgi:energy-coupling factor transporter ATP-binding protein EcfA2